MAVSAVDLRILGQLAEETVTKNALLSSCLFQILGLSVILSQQLTKARSQRRLDSTRDTKSIKLYHHIIWLAREGLSITEVLILPYCQDGEQGPQCRVMVAKMRASFYHVFCLFHNHPPVYQIQPVQSSTTNSPRPSPSHDRITQMEQKPGPRDSMVSESSYVTNPFTPAQSPPPSYPIPPVPVTPSRWTPLYPPGFAPRHRSPPTSATYLLPPLNFVPAADNYFSIAYSLANKFLRGAHPLRLSVAHEYTAFLHDCAKDYDAAYRVGGDAVRAAFSDQRNLSDKEWEEVLLMVRGLTRLAQRSGERGRNNSSDKSSVNITGDDEQLTGPTKPLPTPPTTTPSGKRGSPLIVESRMSDDGNGLKIRSATLVNSPATTVYNTRPKHTMGEGNGGRGSADEGARRSQASSRSSRRGRQEGGGSEKERKRRAVERAEMELSRKTSGQSRASEVSNVTARRV